MTTLRDVTKDQIIDVAVETEDRFPDLKNHELFDLVSDCIGRELTDIEWRMGVLALALVQWLEGAF